VNHAGFLGQHRTKNRDRLGRSLKQLAADELLMQAHRRASFHPEESGVIPLDISCRHVTQGKRSSPMGSFELSGHDLSVRYTAQNRTLVVHGKDLVGQDEQTFSDVKVLASGIGATITVVLLPSSRNGTKVLLHLLVPNIGRITEQVAITGVATVVNDFSHLLDGAPPVHQAYESKALTGMMHA